MKSFELRNVDAIVVGDRNAAEPAADLCSGALSIKPGELRFEPHLERTWTGPIPASDPRPVVMQASTVELTAHHTEWLFFVIPTSLGSRLVIVDDSAPAVERTAIVQLTSWWYRRHVARALDACGFRVSTITLE